MIMADADSSRDATLKTCHLLRRWTHRGHGVTTASGDPQGVRTEFPGGRSGGGSGVRIVS